jgi:hypothetical protein
MARPRKPGLDYFPCDTSFFDDIKIRKLIKYQDGGAVSVYTFLLCTIYSNGYYAKWDTDLPFVVAERTGFDETYVDQVIKYCLGIGLFSQAQYDKNKILTGAAIQERYSNICKTAKRTFSISSEYNCITSEETPVITEQTTINPEQTTVNSGLGTQSKVKERKGKKSKQNKEGSERPFDPYSVVLPFESDVFKAAWTTWVDYRKEIKKPITSTAAPLQVNKLKDVPEDVAIRMINKAIESNWQTFYKLADHELNDIKTQEISGLQKVETYPSGVAKPKLVY